MSSLQTKVEVLRYLPQVFYNLYSGRPLALSFDISDFCNLHCPYCYWWESRKGEEIPLPKIVEIAKHYRRRGVLHATWIGGEPTLRPDVLRAVTSIFPINWVVTNGVDLVSHSHPTFDLFRLPNTWIMLSLDGVGEVHDKSRGQSGLYEKIKARFWDRPILTTTVLHRGNLNQPARLLREWSQSKILGMTFEFATPIGRAADLRVDLVGEARDAVIDELINLKKQYGRFLANSVFGLNMSRSANLVKWSGPNRCPTAKYSVSIDAQGQIKKPCVLGSSPSNPKGKLPNCNACGCHVPTILAGIKRFDFQTLESVFWFLG